MQDARAILAPIRGGQLPRGRPGCGGGVPAECDEGFAAKAVRHLPISVLLGQAQVEEHLGSICLTQRGALSARTMQVWGVWGSSERPEAAPPTSLLKRWWSWDSLV